MYVVRRRLIAQRTALSNQTRGLLAEFGLVTPVGLRVLRRLEQLAKDREDCCRLMRLPGIGPITAVLWDRQGHRWFPDEGPDISTQSISRYRSRIIANEAGSI